MEEFTLLLIGVWVLLYRIGLRTPLSTRISPSRFLKLFKSFYHRTSLESQSSSFPHFPVDAQPSLLL